ncbi:SET domain-containing protein [Stereum hirsutum FP-91666 SS1]|uniref:SET domain-containing protein n=1 Tax=Stereum hirsutum (strain FP-91666) TaxID=721885 RepID=UPI0004449B28|nr:SET domain-containing protein [Stereum hirsutum FP-91666 SS1]EIM83024.1 SET domain-containing protein [Stereum hirsutum FP-91666 SS1]
MESLVEWFTAHGGTYDDAAMQLTDLEGHGRAAVALRDIPEGHTLFTLPRNLTLSTRTSALPGLLGLDEWKQHELHIGWAGLILCMMWEEAQGASSRWSTYLASLPSSFDTPMFWSPDDLEELKGTSVVDKIGRDGAEEDYRSKVVPTLQSRPDLFAPEALSRHYSLENYHLMGSRILSRSFSVERWEGHAADKQEDSASSPVADTGRDEAMDVDTEAVTATAPEAEDGVDEPSFVVDDENDSDDEDEEDPANVAMVPMADMLNARYRSENAKLFYETEDLRMITTKPILKGEQIFNTYGDPPNSDLLRRYGHVDLVPLPNGDIGNPADIVELRGDLAFFSISERHKQPVESSAERVDWWLEEGGEDVFILETNHELPDELVPFCRLLLQSQSEWEKTKSKSKLPKAKVDESILSTIANALERRLAEYPTSVEEDQKLLTEPLSLNRKHAVIVRLGEKRILHGTLSTVKEKLKEMSGGQGKKKRKAEDDHEKGRSKRRGAGSR